MVDDLVLRFLGLGVRFGVQGVGIRVQDLSFRV
jgi:hypothetical protein